MNSDKKDAEKKTYDNILDDIVINKLDLKSKIHGTVALYFICRIRHFGIDSYLLTQSEEINAENSFTEFFFSKHKPAKPILSVDEICSIVDYALTLSEVNELLGKVYLFKDCNSYEKLITIIRLFNTCNIKELSNTRRGRNSIQFTILLKIALLSIPQLAADKKYSAMSSDEIYISGIDKYGKCKSLVDDFNKGQLDAKLADRLLLLVTIIEGYLWKIRPAEEEDEKEDNKCLYNFCIGNLYDFLKTDIEEFTTGTGALATEICDNLGSNWFYLRQLHFYIYGDFDISNTEIIKKQLQSAFISNLSELILFAKSIAAQSNVDNVKKWAELSDTVVPKSVAHGLLTMVLPEKIGIFRLNPNDGDKYSFTTVRENSYFCKQNTLKGTSVIKSLEQLKNPWALYKPSTSNECIIITKDERNTLNKNGFLIKEKYLIIKTANALGECLYIILEIDISNKNEFLDNFEYYKYVFKSFVEKLQDINYSASLNVNTLSWYKKAFCNLYKEYDKVRYEKQYRDNINEFRSWEIDKINGLIGEQTNIIIYDIGACYGRLEEKIIAENELFGKVKKIYAIDQNQDYLNCIQANDKIETHCCDFRSIGLINNDEKADLICFTHTVFGYFDNDADNKLVLEKAFKMLKVGGVIMIDQFNPSQSPKHCNNDNIPVYDFESNGTQYRCIKTSNHSTPDDTKKEYGLYYGNYIYFDTSDKNSEKIFKCDTYSIKLYTEQWFKKILSKFVTYTDCSTEDGETTMLLTIKKLREDGEETVNTIESPQHYFFH